MLAFSIFIPFDTLIYVKKKEDKNFKIYKTN